VPNLWTDRDADAGGAGLSGQSGSSLELTSQV